MAIDDVDVLRTELPEVFEDKALPTTWDDTWHVIQSSDADELGLDEMWQQDDPQQLDQGDSWERWTENNPEATGLPLPIGMEWPGDFPGKPRIWNREESEVSKKGHPPCPPPDCFAFYLPFHYYHPHHWGVYVLAEGVIELGSYIRWASNRQINNTDACKVARLFLYGHESFHHLTESYATRLEITHRHPLYKTGFESEYKRTFGTDACLEEALANSHALRTVWPKIKKHPHAKLIRFALSQYVESCPPGYRLGVKYSKNAAFVRERCRFAEQNHNAGLPAIGKKGLEIWKAFPAAFNGISRINSRVNYLVRRNSPLARRLKLDARYLKYREVEKKLKAANCVFVRPGKGSHLIWRGPTGATQPIPNHPGDVNRNLIQGIIKRLGLKMSLEEFLQLR